jgi:DHA1 family tetracycline resistance protein-like MFS transporter
MLFLSRMLQGIFAANLSSAQAIVADVTTKENRSKGMGLIGAAFGLGFIFGPFLGAQLSVIGPKVGALIGLENVGPFGMGFPAFVASLLCLFNFTFTYFKLPETLKEKNRVHVRSKRWEVFSRAMTKPQLNWLIIAFFLSSFAMANMESTLALLTEVRLHYGIRETGQLFAFVGIMMAFTQGYLIRKLMPVMGERKLLVLGPLFQALALVGTGLVFSTGQILVAMFFLALGSGLGNPALMGAISINSGENEQGSMLGLTQSLGSLARIAGPTIGGFAFAQGGPSFPYMIAGATMGLVVVLCLINAKRIPDVGKVGPELGAH